MQHISKPLAAIKQKLFDAKNEEQLLLLQLIVKYKEDRDLMEMINTLTYRSKTTQKSQTPENSEPYRFEYA